MRVSKSAGSISDFEMFGCMQEPTQSEYESKKIASHGGMTMIGENWGSFDGGSYSSTTSVSGTLGNDLKYTAKSVATSSSNSSFAWSGSFKITLRQYADKMGFSGFQTGEGAGQNAGGSSTARLYAEYEFTDTNTEGSNFCRQKLAMGNGNLKAELENVWSSQTYTNSIQEVGMETLPLVSQAQAQDKYNQTSILKNRFLPKN